LGDPASFHIVYGGNLAADGFQDFRPSEDLPGAAGFDEFIREQMAERFWL
jgi:hypothetical protein